MTARELSDYIECEKPEMPDEAMIQKLNYLGLRVGYSSFGSGLKSDIDSLSGEDPLHILESFFDIWDISSDLIEKIQKAGFAVDKPIREYLTRIVDCCSTGIKDISWFVANGFVAEPHSLFFSVDQDSVDSYFSEIESHLEEFVDLCCNLYEKDLLTFNPVDFILTFNRELASNAKVYVADRGFFLRIYKYTLGAYVYLFDEAILAENVDVAISIFALANTAFRRYMVAARAVRSDTELGFYVDNELIQMVFKERHQLMPILQEKLRKAGREVPLEYGFC